VTCYANSSNIDAAAMGAGPGTLCYPQIATGSPEQIVAYAAQLIMRVRRLEALLEDLERARDQLRQAWPKGPASDNALRKLNNSFQSFQRIIQCVMSAIRELEAAAVQLGIAQRGYCAVVNAVNPTVGALMSNPYTYSAAVALAHGTTASLKGFLSAIAGIMNVIGASNIAQQIMLIAQIAGELERLYNTMNPNHSTTTPGGPSVANPITQPVAPGSVASPSGQAAVGGGGYGSPYGQDPYGQNPYGQNPYGQNPYGQNPGSGGFAPPGGFSNQGYAPMDPNANMFVPIDPGTQPGTQPGAGTPGTASGSVTPIAGGDPEPDVTVTATKGDLSISVAVDTDSGRPIDIEVTATSGSQTVTADVEVSSTGQVTVH